MNGMIMIGDNNYWIFCAVPCAALHVGGFGRGNYLVHRYSGTDDLMYWHWRKDHAYAVPFSGPERWDHNDQYRKNYFDRSGVQFPWGKFYLHSNFIWHTKDIPPAVQLLCPWMADGWYRWIKSSPEFSRGKIFLSAVSLIFEQYFRRKNKQYKSYFRAIPDLTIKWNERVWKCIL